jgi:hypothetical protein
MKGAPKKKEKKSKGKSLSPEEEAALMKRVRYTAGGVLVIFVVFLFTYMRSVAPVVEVSCLDNLSENLNRNRESPVKSSSISVTFVPDGV